MHVFRRGPRQALGPLVVGSGKGRGLGAGGLSLVIGGTIRDWEPHYEGGHEKLENFNPGMLLSKHVYDIAVSGAAGRRNAGSPIGAGG